MNYRELELSSRWWWTFHFDIHLSICHLPPWWIQGVRHSNPRQKKDERPQIQIQIHAGGAERSCFGIGTFFSSIFSGREGARFALLVSRLALPCLVLPCLALACLALPCSTASFSDPVEWTTLLLSNSAQAVATVEVVAEVQGRLEPQMERFINGIVDEVSEKSWKGRAGN
jgi:hypothetical protein